MVSYCNCKRTNQQQEKKENSLFYLFIYFFFIKIKFTISKEIMDFPLIKRINHTYKYVALL